MGRRKIVISRWLSLIGFIPRPKQFIFSVFCPVSRQPNRWLKSFSCYIFLPFPNFCVEFVYKLKFMFCLIAENLKEMKTKIKFLVRLPIAFHFPPIFSATKQSCQHFIEMQWTTNILFLFHFSWCILFQSWKIIRDSDYFGGW